MVEGVQASTEDMESAEYRAEEKVARPSVLAPIRGKLTVASVMVLLSSICSVLPFILIVEASRRLLEGSTEGVWPLLMWALAAYAARAILYSGALFWTHSVDADNQLGMRRLISNKLRSVPLGWFNERRSVDVKKLLQDDVEAIHYLVAHAQVEFVAAVSVPVNVTAHPVDAHGAGDLETVKSLGVRRITFGPLWQKWLTEISAQQLASWL